MNNASIDETSSVYTCSEKASINWRSVRFSELQVFTTVVQGLLNDVGKLDENEPWFDFLRRIRSFRFSVVASLLSEKLLQEKMTELVNNLHASRNRFIQSYPNSEEKYHRLIQIGEHLCKLKFSGLLSPLLEEIASSKRFTQTVVLVCESRFVGESEQCLASAGIRTVEIASPPFLRGDVSFEKMIVIGPTRWFPSYVFSAPRAANILVLKYAWIRDNWKHQPVFIEPLKQRETKLMRAVIDEPFDGSSLDPDILLPPAFDFKNIQKYVMDEGKGYNEVDYVQAKLFLLEEGWVVPLSTEDTANALVIDLGDPNSPVRKMKVNEIVPGIFVLLRTTGGGDFIVPVADQIMGKSGAKAREYQRKWKSLLRTIVINEGYDRVIELLKEHGSIRANYVNVRNWMFDRSIKTESRDDFDAILRILKLENERDLYWELMKQIDHAHRQAGHIIGMMLLDKVKNSDLRVLKRTGKIDFELESENHISITAFQVKEISPDRIQILPWQLGNPIKQGD